MKIRFADSRPSGDYALVLPVAGKDRASLESLGPNQKSIAAALDRQGFEGDASSASEHFVDENGTVRRVLVIGTGNGGNPEQAAEKLGGTAVARLQTSGEKKGVIDVSSLGYSADTAARVALAAALRSWRYDRYRTKLKDNQKATLEEIIVVGPKGAEARYTSRWAPVAEGVSLTRELVPSRRTSSIRKASSSASRNRSRGQGSKSRSSTGSRWKSSEWARCSESLRARLAKLDC